MNAIVKYTPKHEVVFFDSTRLYIDSGNFDLFCQALEKAKFVKIGEAMYATSSIKSVLPAGKNVTLVESLLEGHSEDVKEKVRTVVRQRQQEGLKVTEGVILNIIEKYEHA